MGNEIEGRTGFPDASELYEECQRCNGSGHSPRGPFRCKECNGFGYLPTAEGGKLLDFLGIFFRWKKRLPEGNDW